jgi:hypothetical protein
VVEHALEGWGCGGISRHDEGDDHLAALLVGNAEDRDVGDGRVGVEHVLDLLGRDVLALAMMMSLIRPVMRMAPCASKRPRSPVCRKPSAVNASASSELST